MSYTDRFGMAFKVALRRSPQELAERCQQCRKIISAAKEKQEGEARKNASVLLEQIEQEEEERANKEAMQARKRERKRNKRKAKQEAAAAAEAAKEKAAAAAAAAAAVSEVVPKKTVSNKLDEEQSSVKQTEIIPKVEESTSIVQPGQNKLSPSSNNAIESLSVNTEQQHQHKFEPSSSKKKNKHQTPPSQTVEQSVQKEPDTSKSMPSQSNFSETKREKNRSKKQPQQQPQQSQRSKPTASQQTLESAASPTASIAAAEADVGDSVLWDTSAFDHSSGSTAGNDWLVAQPGSSNRGHRAPTSMVNQTDNFSGSDWKTSGPSGSGSSAKRKIAISVSKHDIGKIIGQGGAVVSALRNMSGIQIDIESARGDEVTERMVYLKGPGEIVHRTYQMIQDLLSGALAGNEVIARAKTNTKMGANSSFSTPSNGAS
ncbi:unnamed protein product, partial [Hydatigera taeniaeformis]|uniref:KH domain-containing protein n=1 Tax=Hydatigena taeniaeformis TaxID=6205 RepID=A0A0R3XB68_HYDTA